MRTLILALIFLTSISAAYATTGIGMMEVPEGSVSKVSTLIDTRIENWGYYRIFVALPEGWVPDEIETYARSYPVRESGLWRIYGLPYNSHSLLGRGEVFTGKEGVGTKMVVKIGERYGWWVKPNEGVSIHVKVDEIESSGIIDPLKIEKENPSMKVMEWSQEFTLELSSPGFITAPWIVDPGTLMESYPAPYSSTIGKETVYYEKYIGESYSDVVDWDEWFDAKTPYGLAITPKPLEMEMEYYPEEIEKVKATLTPVWRVETVADIVYLYEWKRNKEIEGVTFWRDELKTVNVPEWFDWF